jgi:hypothetical protein
MTARGRGSIAVLLVALAPEGVVEGLILSHNTRATGRRARAVLRLCSARARYVRRGTRRSPVSNGRHLDGEDQIVVPAEAVVREEGARESLVGRF